MSGGKKLILYASFFFIMICAFWFFLFRGTDDWKSKLPVIGYVQPFSFVNQAGDTITQKNTQGKVYVANFFFTSCHGICPNMNGQVKKIFLAFKHDPGFMLLSHTCQPEVDSISVLKRYCDSVGSNGRQWQFLTGNKLELYKTARESYHIDDPKNNVGSITDQFLHSQFIALVDRAGQVRGIYDGLKEKEMKQLNTDIGDVMKERSSVGFVNGIFGNAPQQ